MAEDATTPDRPWTARSLARGHAPFAACVLIGWWLRADGLGRAPLAVDEAAAAWAAWIAVTGAAAPAPLPSSAVLFGVQTGLFHLLGSSDGVARMASAAAGTAALAVPWVLRRRLGQVRALALAVLLAFDPIAIASARTADGSALTAAAMWVMVAGLLAGGGAAPHRSAAWAWVLTIALAIGVASGPLIWDAWPLLLLVLHRLGVVVPDRSRRAVMAAAGLMAAVVVATTAFVQAAGPPLMSVSVSEWLARWQVPSGVDSSALWTQLLRRETLAIAIGVGGLAVALPARARGWALAWAVWAGALTFRPGRDLDAWLAVSPPLLLLASSTVAWLVGALSGVSRRTVVSAPVVSGLALALLLLSTVHTAFEVARTTPGPGALRGAHTEPSVRALVEALSARRSHGSPGQPLDVVMQGANADPVLGWYLRHEAGVRWVHASATRGGAGPVLEMAAPDATGSAVFPLRHDAEGIVQVRLR